MEAEYHRSLNQSSLYLTVGEKLEDEDSVRMLHYNKISCFLPMVQEEVNGRQQFCYNITGKLSLDQRIGCKGLSAELLYQVLQALDRACQTAVDYMLSEDSILFQTEYIFVDPVGNIQFCYLPDRDWNIREQLMEFMEDAMKHIDHKNPAVVELAYGVYECMAEEDTSLHAILRDYKKNQKVFEEKRPGLGKEWETTIGLEREHEKLIEGKPGQEESGYLRKDQERSRILSDGRKQERTAYTLPIEEDKQMSLLTETGNKISTESYGGTGTLSPGKIRERTNVSGQKKDCPAQGDRTTIKKETVTGKLKKLFQRKIYTDRYQDEEEFVYEPEEEEYVAEPTMCLYEKPEEGIRHFVYQGTDRSRDFICTKSEILIGSNKKEADVWIDMPMVSRIHARIEQGEDGIYLEDLNSTNGTAVNGQQLSYRQKKLLQKGDIISFAGECYGAY